MNISELSIRRPVLSTVLTIIILLFGFIGYTYLGVREYPSVDNPIISVSCSYTGANADVIENQITEPLEQNINGIPGIRSLTSVSQQGMSRITVEFELSVDLETAANDVRDKVSRAQRYLPRDCDPPTVSKADADAVPILMVALQSNKRSLLELSEIADLTVKEQLQTISDVSSVSIWGEKKYSMRLWLDPTKMSGYGITPVDVKNAIDQENIELPSGSIEGNTTELTIRTLGLMHTPEEFNNLIIKEDANRIIRFSDIGRAELGAADIKSYMKMNGVPMVGVVVVPQPGANHIQIADAVYDRMERMKKDLPEDVTYSYGFDNTKFIRASISEVESTVYEAFVLVIIIIFLFLRDWRVTLVPCIVIPVSLIGAFFVMYVAGFSINVLTMLAVVLSVGLVVDDAIVMTENIYVRIERGMPPKEAGIEGAKEIFFAVISTTITLVAVFFPIVFMEGTTGRLFREFSFVISGSIIISSFAALTFTPMLATKLLKRQEQKNWFYRKTEPFFEGMNRLYSRSLAAFLRKRWIALVFTLATFCIIFVLWNSIPAEMAPLEDRSQITISTIGAEGVSYGIVIPILYAILMGGLCIVISNLLKYSQKQRGILKEMIAKQKMEAAVGMQALCASSNAAQAPYTANGVIQTPYTAASYSAPVSQAAPTLRAVTASEYGNTAAVGQQTYGTPVNDDAKRAVLVRFRKALTPDDREAFSKQIVALNMHQYQQLIQLPLKKTVVTVLLSIFLGGLGIDRFYVGDVKFGIAKLAVTIVSSILLFVPFLGTFASIANGIWKFVDIFFCYKRGYYKKNYENAMGVLRKA